MHIYQLLSTIYQLYYSQGLLNFGGLLTTGMTGKVKMDCLFATYLNLIFQVTSFRYSSKRK